MPMYPNPQELAAARQRLRDLEETKARLLAEMDDLTNDLTAAPLETLRQEFLALDPQIASVRAEIRELQRYRE